LFKFFVLFFGVLEKIRDIEEGIAFEANIDKCRLHSGQNPGYASFINGAGESVFILAFIIDF
jgi:hypothetical protein